MTRYLRTRWRACWEVRWLSGRVWRMGLLRGEWWIGARHDVPADAWVIGLLGLVLVIRRG